MKKILSFFKKNWKKPRLFIPLIILVILILIVISKGGNDLNYDLASVERRDIIQEVSTTGRVKPTNIVDLAFERGGRVVSLKKDVGQMVEKGQVLATLSSQDINAQILQAKSSFQAEQAKLDEMKIGPRVEEVNAAQTAVSNAERSLADAQQNLEVVIEKAEVDLNSSYEAALVSAKKAITTAKSALITLSDIQLKYFTKGDLNSSTLATAKSIALQSLFGVGGGYMTSEAISNENGGIFGEIQNLVYQGQDLRELIDKALESIRKTVRALDAVPVLSSLTTTEKTSLASEKTSLGTELSTLSSKRQAIDTQEVANSSAISKAKTSVSTAENNLATAKDSLEIKLSGYSDEQIASQLARVNSAQANWLNFQAQLEKGIIRASFKGIVTKIDVEVGEVVSMNTPVISLISEKKFEIETNIAEVDISKVEIDKTAKITFDAYGSDVVFEAKIVSIDPAETLIEGVAVYKTKLEIVGEDKRVKSGLTANIDILADSKENVLAIPQRGVFSRDGKKWVNILTSEGAQEKEVKVGLRGSEGYIEILSGLEEGDQVITSIRK